jgi:galactokinase
VATYAHQRVYAPGRVNLIGEHTDHTGGLAMPMAIQLGTTIEGRRRDGRLRLRSEDDNDTLDIALPVADAAATAPRWGRYPAAVAAELESTVGFDGTVRSTLPIGAGLSSSASLEVASALALAAYGTPRELAELCQRAEHRATGVPCGIMDQLASAGGVAGHALLIDCTTLVVTPVAVSDSARFVIVDSGQRRALENSAYGERRRSAEAAARIIGPLNGASLADLDRIGDPLIARRARHVITENRRVVDFASALGAGDLDGAGALMIESHHSLRDDFEVSTDRLDQIVARLVTHPKVYGARLTGAGFGGWVIALCRPDAEIDDGLAVEASAGPRIDTY